MTESEVEIEETEETRTPGRPKGSPNKDRRARAVKRADRALQKSESAGTTGRRERKPMGMAQKKLDARIPPGFKGRWFNDTPGRINEALQSDWTFVSDAGVLLDREGKEIEGSNQESDMRVSQMVDRGSGQKAYLMVKPKEWYDEDQIPKQQQLDQTDDMIYSGQLQNQPGSGRYSPEMIRQKGMVDIKVEK